MKAWLAGAEAARTLPPQLGSRVMDAGAEGALFLQSRPAGHGIVLLRIRVALPHLSRPNLEALIAVQRVVFMVVLKPIKLAIVIQHHGLYLTEGRYHAKRG